MPQRIFQVDSFTDTPFCGNPACVCILATPRDAEWMQAVAGEMNVSETAFLYPRDSGYNLRWFTPLVEVDLCGHATLASAHVLWTEGYVERSRPIRFHTRSGLLIVTRAGDLISMDFPALPVAECEPPDGLLEALGVSVTFVGRNAYDFLVEVPDEATLRSCRPDYDRLAEVTVEGAIITTRSTGECDFLSRYFAPRVGIIEDPATGAAHCALGPYWASKLGKNTVGGYQASRRGGTIRVTVADDRVHLAGQAVTVLRGDLIHARGPVHQPPIQGEPGSAGV